MRAFLCSLTILPRQSSLVAFDWGWPVVDDALLVRSSARGRGDGRAALDERSTRFLSPSVSNGEETRLDGIREEMMLRWMPADIYAEHKHKPAFVFGGTGA